MEENDRMKRCVIVGGAGIRHYEEIRQYLSENEL